MATNSRSCHLSSDSFCYVCGYYISPKQTKHTIVPGSKCFIAYEAYFGMPMGDQDKPWAPHVCCGSCRSTLEGWLRGSRKCMPFAIPRIWREPTNHHDDCYFCIVDISKYKKGKDRRTAIVYPNIPSSIAPVPHCEDLPIPTPTSLTVISDTDESEDIEDVTFNIAGSSNSPHFPTQPELNDLVRDLSLTKENAEVLTSRLNEWNLLDPSCKTSMYRKRHLTFSHFFKVLEGNLLCYCSDVVGLFGEIGIEYNPSEWRLFIDSSTKSLKAVLLHNGNKHPSVPVGHSVHMKEDYENVKILMDMLNYTRHNWDICGDFKMLAFLLGLQGGYTKYSCFLCLWDSRADAEHYHRREWPVRSELTPGTHNVLNNALVQREKILLPSLHIKLGLVKQFIKALSPQSEAFKHVRLMFPKLSEAKVKGGIFIGPQIRLMLASEELENKMASVEKNAWQAFRLVVEGFLGNKKCENYKELVENLIVCYRKLGCRMSLKVHYLHSHLDFFC